MLYTVKFDNTAILLIVIKKPDTSNFNCLKWNIYSTGTPPIKYMEMNLYYSLFIMEKQFLPKYCWTVAADKWQEICKKNKRVTKTRGKDFVHKSFKI